MTYDLILRGGRVIDPSQKLDGVMDVAFSGGKVAKRRPASSKATPRPTSATCRARSSRRA